MDSLELLYLAATNCLEKSSYQCHEIELLIYCGVYRSEYLMEPAYAALLAGKLEMNASLTESNKNKTFVFDIFNGAIGFMNACYTAQQIIKAGNCKTAMIVTSEIENNADLFPESQTGIRETTSAIIIDTHPIKNKGFSHFQFNYYTELLDAYTTNCFVIDTDLRLMIEKNAKLEEKYIDCILSTTKPFLEQEGLDFNQIDIIFPPQISSDFIVKLSKQLGVPHEKFVDAVGEGLDLFSSSIPFGITYAYENKLVKSGDTGIIISVGSGIQVGCTIYQF